MSNLKQFRAINRSHETLLIWRHAMPRLHRLTAALALAAFAQCATAQTSNSSNFIGLPSSVAAGALPESAPFLLANSAWTQLSIADRATQLASGQFNSGSWDMIDSNRTGTDSGHYLFMGFETNQAGIRFARVSLQTDAARTRGSVR